MITLLHNTVTEPHGSPGYSRELGYGSTDNYYVGAAGTKNLVR
jgi:hypothetical protein